MGGVMITVAAIIPVALVAGSLIGVLLNARLARRRQQAELRGPQLDEFVQSAFQALRELRVRSELTAKITDAVDRAYGANTLDPEPVDRMVEECDRPMCLKSQILMI